MPRSSKEQIPYFILALVSVFLGFTVWVIIRHQETEIRTIPVNVTYENLPPYIELMDYEPKQIFVSFSLAKADELLLGQTGQFSITVNLEELADKSINIQSFEVIPVQITQDDVESPQNLTFVRFDSPDKIQFTAMMRVATAKVSANLKGDPARGFELDSESITITPSEVQVALDTEVYNQLGTDTLSIPTQPIDITNKSEGFKSLFDLIYSETAGIYPIPKQDKKKVEVELGISEIRENKVFPNIPVRYEPLRRDILAVISPQVTSVTINGPSSILATIDREDINVTPISDQNLDKEEPGTTVEIALRVNLNIEDSNIRQKLNISVSTPSVVISFSQLERTLPAPTPTPEPIVEVVPEVTPEPTVVEQEADETTPSLQVMEEDGTSTPTVEVDE